MGIRGWISERWQWTDAVVILLVAAILRLTLLDLRPPQADEGIDGWLAETMTWSHGYNYRPDVAHGPLHFHLLKLSFAWGGRSYWALRLPTALFGLGGVALCIAFHPFIGRRAAQIAAILMAVSPSFTWVSRYAIHETELVFFTLLCALGILRLLGGFSPAGVMLVVGGAVGCLLTKETALLHLAALVGGLVAASRPWPRTHLRWQPTTRQWRQVFCWIGVGAIGLGIVWGFYTGFGRQPDGWTRFADGFTRWAVIGTGGEEHAKPWWYWLKLLAVYEVPLLAALIASPLLIQGGGRPVRFFTAASLVLFLGYSLVPYKTPWCLVSLGGFLPLLAGCAFGAMSRGWLAAIRPVVTLLLVGLAACDCFRLNFWRYSDPAEAHVYAATSADIQKLARVFDRHLHVEPYGHEVFGKVVVSLPHPLPWLLGDFMSVDYFDQGRKPPIYDSGFMVVDAAHIHEAERAVAKNSYFRMAFVLHDGEAPCVLYLRKEIFAATPLQ